MKTCAVVNVIESSIARDSNFVLPIHCGPEIGVASTKAFLGQILVLYILSLKLSSLRNEIKNKDYQEKIKDLKNLPKLIEETLLLDNDIQAIASTFNEAKGLRPTLGKVRETLFNWLGQDLYNKNCLDLFAGTGALGFEALSRNADSCTFIENNPSTFQKLLENKKNLNAENAIIKKINADFFIKNNAELFDIIFFDPPFVLDNSVQLIDVIRKFLKPKGVIYFETNIRLPENFIEIIKTSRAGKVYFHLVHWIDFFMIVIYPGSFDPFTLGHARLLQLHSNWLHTNASSSFVARAKS